MPTATSEMGLADVGFAEPGLLDTPDVIYQYTTLDATLAGLSLEDIISVKCTYGWDQGVDTADITLRSKPAAGDYMDPVSLTVNGVLRFVGVMADNWDVAGWPSSIVLHARGELTKAEKYINRVGELDTEDGQPGLRIEALLGGPDHGTLKQIVTAVLDVCGVTYDPANFADPPHVYGLEAPEELTWRFGESGLAYLHRIFEATAGYRLFHSGDGQLYLAQIVGRPRADPPDLTLTYGTDILDGARAQRDKSKARNGVTIKGYDDGAGDGPLQVDVVNANYAWSPGIPLIETVSSSLIEDAAFATDLANNYWIQELDRELWTASIPTWRDDVMGPAQTVLLDATDELDVGEPGWMLGFTLEVNEQNQLTQTPQLVGGGLPVNYVPVPV